MSNPQREQVARRQYGALLVAETAGDLRVLLITSRETRRWVIPKGWAEDGLTPPELAAKEAFEEAGALGAVEPEPLGSYRYRKRLKAGRLVACEVGVFPLRVERLLDQWPEADQRERRWFSPREAADRVDEPGLTELLLRLEAAPPAARGEAWFDDPSVSGRA